ncbi:MAG: hypothetical protein IANPNBLG_00355 [Bryobacteraceae bacterium]|nr:hypothetical protein [Bryobacteraceae bacterium]
MSGQTAAILWAQWRALLNFYPRAGRGGVWFSIIIATMWYGLWALGAVAVGMLVRESQDPEILYRFLAPGLLLAFLYWQIIPILMVTSGMSLQLKRLRVYPIPHASLFGLEVLLRMTTAVEMILLFCGATGGLLLSPRLPFWYAGAFVPYLLFNLFMSAGIRDLITRMLALRRFREIMVFFLLVLAALPQLFLRVDLPPGWRHYLDRMPVLVWPWSATAKLIAGDWNWHYVAASLSWMLIAYAFGRRQFERGLGFDEEAARSAGNEGASGERWAEWLFRLPAGWLGDPLAALVEKELRTLVRSPRFRIVFVMGFSFGLLVWLPMMFGGKKSPFLQAHFLVIVCAYAMMLLSEVSVWNVLGFDRSAAQIYWLAPVRAGQMLVAKNLATVIFVTVEILIVSAVCLLFRMPVTPLLFFESFFVCIVMLVLLMAIGNLSSLRYPRPVDPNQNWKRGSASRFQAMLLFVYPVLGLPFILAYFARDRWESDLAFYTILAVTALGGAIAYGFSIESASKTARQRKEFILTTLGGGEGPVSS